MARGTLGEENSQNGQWEKEGGARLGAGHQEPLIFLMSRIKAIENFKQVYSFEITLAAGWRAACRVRWEEGATGGVGM